MKTLSEDLASEVCRIYFFLTMVLFRDVEDFLTTSLTAFLILVRDTEVFLLIVFMILFPMVLS